MMFDGPKLGKALFPISLSNQRYSSNAMRKFLPEVVRKHSSIDFLVADDLHLYNKSLRAGNELPLGTLISDFYKHEQYLEQRQRWLRRIFRSIDIDPEEYDWRIYGIDKLLDRKAYHTLRNVLIAAAASEEFRNAIDQEARQHALTRQDRYPFSKAFFLSKSYIMEEIALSIRVHVIENIEYEYYIGKHMRLILDLYRNDFGFSVSDLAEESNAAGVFEFFTPSESSEQFQWLRCD